MGSIGQDDLLVALGSPQVGESEGQSGHDLAASGGMQCGVGVVATDDDFAGVGVDFSGVVGESAGSGGHHGDVPVGDPLLGGPAERTGRQAGRLLQLGRRLGRGDLVFLVSRSTRQRDVSGQELGSCSGCRGNAPRRGVGTKSGEDRVLYVAVTRGRERVVRL